MQFTPQQLSGGPKFNSKVKIGNWAEDRSRAEVEAKDYALRKKRGELLTGGVERATRVCLQGVPHSYSADGCLRFGDTVQLRITLANPKGEESSHYLATNPFERADAAWKRIVTSATNTSAAVARNTFVITRPTKPTKPSLTSMAFESKESDDVLCYGQPFYLATNPSLRLDERTGMCAAPYFLSSSVGSTVLGRGSGTSQAVDMALGGGAGAEWKVISVTGDALATEGTPVPANADVALVHVVTNQRLAAALGETSPGDFGDELAVSCRTYKGKGRVSSGSLPAEPNNRWQLVTSRSPEAAVDTRAFKELTPADLINKVKEVVLSRGSHGMRGLGRAFRIMDDRRDGKLDREDLKWGLHDYGVHLKDDEFEMVLDFFDRNNDGVVSLTEFLTALRGDMNERRMSFVREAFKRLDKDGSGLVTLDDLTGVYDTSFHPEVKSGKMTHEEALTDFMAQWDMTDKDGIVTFDEFTEYYKDVSSSIDDDDYFELMMRNAWHISGGEGWAANTSCRRVLVVHSDDSQEVCEIKDDLGLKDDDIAEMIRRLESQGVTDIKRISLTD